MAAFNYLVHIETKNLPASHIFVIKHMNTPLWFFCALLLFVWVFYLKSIPGGVMRVEITADGFVRGHGNPIAEC